MGDVSTIEWTDSTWNPARGCSRVSPGCGGPGPHGGCYAEKIAARFSGPGGAFEGFAHRVGGEPRWTGKVELVEDALALPLRWKKPRRIFVNSMSDLFHENLPDEAIDRVFAVMAMAPQHTFQVLTKRADRMRAFVNGWKPATLTETGREWPLPNVWLGVSVEDQLRADERIPHLLATPAAVRFLSCEPLLGPVDLRATLGLCGFPQHIDRSGRGHYRRSIDWVIAGAESGPRARPCDLNWVRDIRDACVAASVPLFWKQHVEACRKISLPMLDGQQWAQFPEPRP